VTRPRREKQTTHRRAAAKPGVESRIALLRKRWKRASPEERRERVLSLLDDGCKIGDLAKNIHQPETSVRRYAKAAPDAPEKEQPKAGQLETPGGTAPGRCRLHPPQRNRSPPRPRYRFPEMARSFYQSKSARLRSFPDRQ
jgi:hypothetical protein